MLPPPRQQKEARICFLLLWRKERMRLAGDIPLCNYSKLVLWADPATVPAWERRASLFKERQWFSLVVYFIRSINSVYMSAPTSQFLPSSPSPLVSIGCSLCLCLYFCFVNKISRGFPGGLDSKESACNGETWVQSLGWKDPLEKGTATHSSILAWRIPWTEESGRLQSMELQTVRHDRATDTFTLIPR